MPPKRMPEAKDMAPTEECILQYGRNNNIIQWQENVDNYIATRYGLTGKFMSTNVRYVIPAPREADYIDFPEPEEGEDPLPNLPATLVAELRKSAYESRRKAVETQRSDERLIYGIMWGKMSEASQSRVREEAAFNEAYQTLDCVQLWTLIRRTHLTHAFGDGDPMAVVNTQAQEARYFSMKQNEKEPISAFKTRFDHQIKANTGAGVPAITEARRALDFIMKLDNRRYRSMRSEMQNNALCGSATAYPQTLADAYRISAGWNVDFSTRNGDENLSAFLADETRTSKHKGKTAKRSEKMPESKDDRICYVCGKEGHIARVCPEKKMKSVTALVSNGEFDEGDRDFDEEHSHSAFNISDSDHAVLFSQHDLILDTAASISIIRNRDILTRIKASHHITVNGVRRGSPGIVITEEGCLGDFGIVYLNEKSAANILSMSSQVDSGAAVSYIKDLDQFQLTPKGCLNHYVFKRKAPSGSAVTDRFYCYDIRDMNKKSIVLATVSQNMQRFTAREVSSAMKAKTMMARLGFPSITSAMAMVSTGKNFDVCAHDFKVAEAIWGPDLSNIRGKTTKKHTQQAAMVPMPSVVQINQVLSVDIMFLEGAQMLIADAHPLDLTIAVELKKSGSKPSRAAQVIKMALTECISLLASRRFNVTSILSDGEGAIGKVKTELQMLGIEVDIGGAGGHVPRIERKIRTIKNSYRAHTAGGRLPFKLCALASVMLILFCVSRINYQLSSTRPLGPSPREAFLGRALDAKKDFSCAFGDYVEATVAQTDNTATARTQPCVVMLPTGNLTGSVTMLSLTTGRLVRRDQFRILPTSQYVVDRMNELAAADGHVSQEHAEDVYPSSEIEILADSLPATMEINNNEGNKHFLHRDTQEESGGESNDDLDAARADDHISGLDVNHYTDDLHSARADNNISGLDVNHPGDQLYQDPDISYPVTSAAEAESPSRETRPSLLDYFRSGAPDQNVLATIEQAKKEKGIRQTLVRQMTRTEKWIDREYALTISVKAAIAAHGGKARKVIMDELVQMVTKKVWRPIEVSRLTISERRSIIRSSMFIKEKFFPDGTFEKLKARLVAGGDKQDRSLYEDLSAPTVLTSSVFSIAAVAAMEHRHVMVVDIGGAFLNVPMDTGVVVHMRLDPIMSRLMTDISPEYRRYADNKGCIVVALDKALYGLVESAALWNKNLTNTLVKYGFQQNRYDPCVFNMNIRGVQCTVAIHVDDLLITSIDKLALEEVANHLQSVYKDIRRVDGPRVGYLGMMMDLTGKGKALITMDGFTNDVLDNSSIDGLANTPATDYLFVTREDAGTVTEDQRVHFHTMVAKMLYLAKRVRPECLPTVAFLATRVTKCDQDDLGKLRRLVRYVRFTKDRGVCLCPTSMEVSTQIDAAYGVHVDGKSHTGSSVSIGDGATVHSKSSKQKNVTKSSTEAELVALSDSATQGLHVRNFMREQGHDVGPLVIYQDNLSTMALIEKGRSTSERSRHIDIRFFWLKERVDAGEAVIRHLSTKSMFANILTKPLQGAQFKTEREGLTGWV